jgi:alginate O-acetyltransferase complex protein AlgI
MIFSSLQYLLFLPIVVLLYWRTRGATRLWLLVAASYFFYMSWLPVYGILLLVMTTANWLLALAMERSRQKNPSLLKPLLWLGLIGNLGCLCYYKYTNFFLSNFCSAINWFGAQLHGGGGDIVSWTTMNVMLPLGISFFVFEFVHYLVDVYRGDKPISSWSEFAAFSAFFPSQIAGPIKRFQEFMPFLHAPLPWTSALFAEGGALIMQGLFKKVAIADPIGSIVNGSFAPHVMLSSPDALIASFGFFIQVYCDFSGYTDIGRGSALLLGIRLPENFRLPYLSVDLADFWRRWHMSLGSWLRDYVYIPLGGSRCGSLANNRNLFLTMVACGLWHGAAWHYVIFGCLQGAGLIVQRQWRDFLRSNAQLERFSQTAPSQWAGIATTALFIIVTFTIFRAPDMPTGLNVLSSWFTGAGEFTLWLPIVKSGVLWLCGIYMLFWLLSEALKKQRQIRLFASVALYPSAIRFASWTAATFLMIAARPTVATPFVYFQF